MIAATIPFAVGASMRIFGIDPGTRVLGYGVIEEGGSQPRLVSAGSLSAPARLPLPERLLTIGRQLEEALRTHGPDVVAIERPFYGKNVAALIALGEARGVAVYAAARQGLAVHEYAPAEIKRAVTGRGMATKEQVAGMVSTILGGVELPNGLDPSDALAVALCHSQRHGFLELDERAGTAGGLSRRIRTGRRGRGR